jgi:hypothetical protein
MHKMRIVVMCTLWPGFGVVSICLVIVCDIIFYSTHSHHDMEVGGGRGYVVLWGCLAGLGSSPRCVAQRELKA